MTTNSRVKDEDMGRSLPPGSDQPGRVSTPVDPLAAAVGEGADRLPIPTGVPLVLAVSGGGDSMALMHGAAAVAPDRGWQLVVAHLDHGLRPESADDARFVADAAEALGLSWEIRRTDVGAEAAETGTGVEDAGRRARYEFLEAVAADRGGDALIATAHTADDLAETVLLNLVRGAGQRGVRGMPARRGRVVRPLLHSRRATLRAALEAAGIAYRDDPTNRDPDRSRAAIRAEVLPVLERLNPEAVEAIGRFAGLAGEEDAFLDALAAEELRRRRGEDGAIDWHAPPPPALGRRVLRLAIGDPAPAAERIDALLAAASGPRGGIVIELGRGRSASVRERRIVIGQ
jgi:tRNA(Ile)-lysidine synthase